MPSYVQSCQTDTHWPTERCPPCSWGVAQGEPFGPDSEKSIKKAVLSAEVELLFKCQISYKDESMPNPNWPPSLSKWRSEHYQRGGGEASFHSKPPETLQTLFCDTLISPTKNSEPGPREAVSGARYFLWNKQHCSASANRAGLSEGSSI